MISKFDIFNARFITVYNVKILDVAQASNGYELLTVEYENITHDLQGAVKYNANSSPMLSGQIGYVESKFVRDGDLGFDGFLFYAYIDQSLRRLKELDRFADIVGENDRKCDALGWICDAKPNGFRAPVGIIPGENGNFIPDLSNEVSLRVPHEFQIECRRFGISPEEVLTGFMADVAGLQNYKNCPRADGFQSSGSDERDLAESYLLRAYGHFEVDLLALEQSEFEQEQREAFRDEISGLMDDYESSGGNPSDLIAAVQELVNKKMRE